MGELDADRARAVDRHHQLAAGAELLDAVVAPVGDVEVACGVNRDAPGQVELAGPDARFAEPAEQLAVAVEALQAVVHRVDDPEVALGVELHPGGAVELARFGAVLAPLPELLALGGVDGHFVRGFVEHVEIAVVVVAQQGDGPDEAGIGHRAQVLVVQGDHADVAADAELGAADHVDAIVADGDADGEGGDAAHAEHADVGVSGAEQRVGEGHGVPPVGLASLVGGERPLASWRRACAQRAAPVRNRRPRCPAGPGPSTARSSCRRRRGSQSCA